LLRKEHRAVKKFALALVIIAEFVVAPALAQEPQGTPPPSQYAGSPAGWRYDAILYGWFSGLKGTIGVTGVAEEPVDATFDDLAGYVDFAMAGHFEAKNAKAVFVGDLSYVGLGAERDAQVANETVKVDLDIAQWILELGGGYRFTPEFDVLVVGRYYLLDMGATSESVAGESAGDVSENWGDIYVGARYSMNFKTKWFFSIRGDIGVGGSEFAWFGNAALGYRFSGMVSAIAAYRVLSLDREGDTEGDYFKYDVTQDGPGIGLGFTF
jgi:hypothetical protein